jgi:hypothetical protein
MGMDKTTLILVASGITVATAVGIYLLVNKLGKKNSE